MPERLTLSDHEIVTTLTARIMLLASTEAAPSPPPPLPQGERGAEDASLFPQGESALTRPQTPVEAQAATLFDPSSTGPSASSPKRTSSAPLSPRGRGAGGEGEAIYPPHRRLIGLVGGPGSGKSTLTTKLIAALTAQNIKAAAIPMDGFHMRHAKLETLGLVERKGAPGTFEAQAFVDFLALAKQTTKPLSGPIYTRDIEDVTDNGYTIAPDTDVLIVEGNYLLLDTPPWHGVRALLDMAIYLDIARETVRARLLARHAEHGLFSHDHIIAHVERVDLPNYDLIAATAANADLVLVSP